MRIATALAAIAVPLLACECHQLTVCELLQQPTLFVGEVVSGGVGIREDPWNANGRTVRFKVLENFRGLPKDASTVDVDVPGTVGMCAPIPFYVGGRYLVAPRHGEDGKLHEGVCFASRDVDRMPAELRLVREYFAGMMPTNIRGRVAVAKAGDLVDFQLELGEARTLEGVRVWTSRWTSVYATNTNAAGEYTLPLPAGGAYTIHTDLAPYKNVDPTAAASVANRGCRVQNVAMRIDNTISGRVRDKNGQPIENARVGLIDLDHPNPPDQHAWFRDAYAEQKDDTFVFESVPVGRYLLVFNPDGPMSGGRFDPDPPLESTYYPSGTSRTSARVVEIKSGGVHLSGMDLTVGQPVTFRAVTVHARFAGGQPMTTGFLRVTGAPLAQNEPAWNGRGRPQEDRSSFELEAPANRRLTIEFRDAYGRKLNGRYTATFEPGITPITQDFVIEP